MHAVEDMTWVVILRARHEEILRTRRVAILHTHDNPTHT